MYKENSPINSKELETEKLKIDKREMNIKKMRMMKI